MSTDQPTVAADRPAVERLDSEFDVDIQHAHGAYLITHHDQDEDLAVLVYAGTDVDAGQLHAGIAAVCHHGLAKLHDDQEVLER